jgi:acetyltransferase-like isoleucine patch superfamily enzyme
MVSSFEEQFRGKFPDTMIQPRGRFHLDSVKRLGRYAYGDLNVLSFGGSGEHLEIGEWVSIGPDVLFVLGGEHPYDGLTTFPYDLFVLGGKYDPTKNQTKGPIIVMDDVWIGTKAMILSGVNIGQGAIIGAGALVANDVLPYRIVAGSPARAIGCRFSQDMIEKLMDVDFKKLTSEVITKLRKELKEPLSIESLDKIIAKVGRK